MTGFGSPWPEYNDGLTYSDIVSPSDSGLKLIEFYSSKHRSSASLRGWLQRINNRQITVDGDVITDPDSIVRAGSKLLYHRLPWKEPDAPYFLEVLYEDDIMIALDKPSGLQVLPGGLFQQRTVLTQLQWHSTKHNTSSQCREPHPVPVHRLGRGTSGILLCAKTKLAKACLAGYFSDGTSAIGGNSGMNIQAGTNRRITKIYRALASGTMDMDEMIINQPIGTTRYPGVARGLYVALPSGKPALSKISVLEQDRGKNQTLVQVEIQSGRPHQIRIHLAFAGHPLLGDPLYISGGQPKCFDPESADESYLQDGGYPRPVNPVPGDCGYYLHAHQVNLFHPTKEEMIKIISPLPFVLRTTVEVASDRTCI